VQISFINTGLEPGGHPLLRISRFNGFLRPVEHSLKGEGP